MARQSTLNFARGAQHISWKHPAFDNPFRTVLFGVYGDFAPRTKIAAFDLDGTLIRPKSGLKFPRNASDWTFLRRDIKSRLSTLVDSGYAIVIVSNQNYASKPAKLDEWQLKMSSIGDRLHDIPFVCIAATTKDRNRKPDAGMWECLEAYFESVGDVKPDTADSFFVGDAAGRPSDHSADDKNFAKNVELAFYTPEEYFAKEASKVETT